MPIDFRDGSGFVPKLFIVIGHKDAAAIAFKTTSKLGRYGDNPHLYPGIVFIPAGPSPFTEPTVIEPSNAFAITHEHIRIEQERSRIKVWPSLEGLLQRLCVAIEQNPTLTKTLKPQLKTIAGCL
jgi:hypothetical protein